MGQAQRLLELFSEAGFVEVKVDKDYGGHDRVASGVKP
jgi:hypothetical protein